MSPYKHKPSKVVQHEHQPSICNLVNIFTLLNTETLCLSCIRSQRSVCNIEHIINRSYNLQSCVSAIQAMAIVPVEDLMTVLFLFWVCPTSVIPWILLNISSKNAWTALTHKKTNTHNSSNERPSALCYL